MTTQLADGIQSLLDAAARGLRAGGGSREDFIQGCERAWDDPLPEPIMPTTGRLTPDELARWTISRFPTPEKYPDRAERDALRGKLAEAEAELCRLRVELGKRIPMPSAGTQAAERDIDIDDGC